MLENSLNPLPFAFRLDPASHANQVSAGSLFTPPNVSSATTGVKRARGASQSSTNHPQSVIESDAPTTRPVRGVPEKRGAGSTNGPTRRSSRLSAAPATAAVNSVNAFASHLQPQSASTRGTQQRTSKKRSKAERGQAVLADQSVPSPASASSSPAPSSPSMALPTQLCASPESEYVLDILRKFGKAVACESNFEHEQALQPLLGLPMDQQRSLFCLLLLGRIHMEMLQYEKVGQRFVSEQVRFAELTSSFAGRTNVRSSSSTRSALSREHGAVLRVAVAFTLIDRSLDSCPRIDGHQPEIVRRMDRDGQRLFTARGSWLSLEVFPTCESTGRQEHFCLHAQRSRMRQHGGMGPCLELFQGSDTT